MIYAGIGSRSTPPGILNLMEQIGFMMAYEGWTLRSGYAQGADRAFYQGFCAAPHHPTAKAEMYLPWEGFNGAHSGDGGYYRFYAGVCEKALVLAEAFHPAWNRCKPAAKLLHARNGYQVLGSSLREPANLVICWTPGAMGGGGTGQALRIASASGIPIMDLADPEMEAKARDQVKRFFEEATA
jgi:hypothetical protein